MAPTASPKGVVEDTCPRCTDKGTKACGGCENIKYCSLECQQADWPTHRVLCSTFKDFAQRPSADKCRVVAFLPGEKKPRFLWAPVVNNSMYTIIDPSDLAKTKHKYDPKMNIYHNAWTNKNLSGSIQVLFA